MSKARVAPVKRMTLPRLELMGSLLAARLLKFVIKALNLPSTISYFCWTDSQVALAWIKGSPDRWKQFVANRVSEIHELTDPSRWNFCPGKQNPADLTTRGVNAAALNSDIWLYGPEWLSGPVSGFPGENEDQLDNIGLASHSIDEEMVTLVAGSPEKSCSGVFEFARWGKFSKAIRVIGWVRRYIHNSRTDRFSRSSGDLTYEELSVAKCVLFKCVQDEAFPQELDCLKKGKPIPKSSSIYRLTPFLSDDGLMRVKSRLLMSELCFEEKYPIIVPKGHIAVLLVRFYHVRLKHAGVNAVISSLRDTYWIIGVRSIAKRVKKFCVPCARLDSKPCNEPVAPLPKLRISESPPFTVVGLDFAGPLFCLDFPKKKFYILLFTCAVVRAIHLELTESMSTESFLLAFRRFAARRGMPSVIYSDNAQTFVAARDHFLRIYGDTSPEWNFIVPRSPWWGGWWERLVRSTKSSLKRCLGKRSLSLTELETTLIEVESCINSRPLTFCGDDVEYMNPLSPNHFLLGRRAEFKPDVIEDYDSVNRQSIVTQDKLRSQLLDRFWQIWRNEYLRELPVTVHKFHKSGDLQIGSVVLIKEDNVPRMKWELGVVTELILSKDGIPRSAILRTNKGSRTRAIHRLHSLELVEDANIVECLKSVKKPAKQVLEETSTLDNLSSDLDVPKLNDKESVPEAKTSRSGRILKPVKKLNL